MSPQKTAEPETRLLDWIRFCNQIFRRVGHRSLKLISRGGIIEISEFYRSLAVGKLDSLNNSVPPVSTIHGLTVPEASVIDLRTPLLPIPSPRVRPCDDSIFMVVCLKKIILLFHVVEDH